VKINFIRFIRKILNDILKNVRKNVKKAKKAVATSTTLTKMSVVTNDFASTIIILIVEQKFKSLFVIIIITLIRLIPKNFQDK